MASTSTKRARSKASQSRRQAMDLHQPLDEEINDFEGPKGSTEPKTALTKTHYLVVDEIANTNVYDLLEFQGWLNFLREPLPTKPSLVHWFYRYFKTQLSHHYVPKVNLVVNMPDGSKLEYNQDDFANEFGLVGDIDRVDVQWESRAFTEYDLNTWPNGLKEVGINNLGGVIARLNNLSHREEVTEWLAGSVVLDGLTGDDKLLLKIVKGIVLPVNSNDNSISDILGVIVCMIRERVKINLPVLILKHMQQAPSNRQATTLPYGGLITHIVRRWGIVPEGDEPEIPAIPIGRLTYRKQQSILIGRQLVQEWEEPLLTAEEREEYATEVRKKSRGRASASRRARGDEVPGPMVIVEEGAREGARTQEDLAGLAARVARVERRQGRMMRLLRSMAEKMGCTSADVALGDLSPDE